METLRSVITAILVVILAFSFLCFQLALILNITFMQPAFYQEVFASQQFYGQIRQVLLKTVKNVLPDAQDSFFYLEKALTEEWLANELPLFLEDLFSFFRHERAELPLLPFKSLQDRLMIVIDKDISEEAKLKLIHYWFPTYEEIRIQDFTSTNIFWLIRGLFPYGKALPWATLAVSVLLFLLLALVDFNWRSALLWFGAGVAASGTVAVALGMALKWGLGSSSIIVDGLSSISALGIPKESVEGIFWAFVNAFIGRLNMLSVACILSGGLVIHFSPIRERVLRLVK